MFRVVVLAAVLVCCAATPALGSSVPANLTPSLADAVNDLPLPYRDGCAVTVTEHDYHHCNYGPRKATVRIALFGDSHAAQWFPALRRATRRRGWRLDYYQRAACPSADVTIFNLVQQRIDVDCAAYREAALAAMAADPPTVVILTNRADYPLYDANDQPIPAADREAAWDVGLRQTLAELPASTTKIVLADTPLPAPLNVVTCLQANLHNVGACQRRSTEWIREPHLRGERATARSIGALFANLNTKVCPASPCHVIAGNVLIYRDDSHLTATFSATLAIAMGNLLDRVHH